MIHIFSQIIHCCCQIWYKFSIPPESTHYSISSIEQAIGRRAKLVSWMMLLTVWLALLTILLQAFKPSFMTILAVTAAIIIDLCAIYFFNRRGKTVCAGIIITLTTEIGQLLNFWQQITLEGGVSLRIVLLMLFLSQAIIIAIVTTNALFSFCVFAGNTILTLLLVIAPQIFSLQHLHPILLVELSAPIEIFQSIYIALYLCIIYANNAIKDSDEAVIKVAYIEIVLQKYQNKVSAQEKDMQECVAYLSSLLYDPHFHSEQEYFSPTNQFRSMQQLLSTLAVMIRAYNHEEDSSQVAKSKPTQPLSPILLKSHLKDVDNKLVN